MSSIFSTLVGQGATVEVTAQWASDHHYQLKSIDKKYSMATEYSVNESSEKICSFMAFLSHDLLHIIHCTSKWDTIIIEACSSSSVAIV